MAETDPTQTTEEARDEPPNTKIFLQLATRESLEKIPKPELQKRCREMGLNRVWVNKDQLIDMILHKIQSASTSDVLQHENPQPTTAQTPQFNVCQVLQPDTPQDSTPIPDLRLSQLPAGDSWRTPSLPERPVTPPPATQQTLTPENPFSGYVSDATQSPFSRDESDVEHPLPSRDEGDTAQPPIPRDDSDGTCPLPIREKDTEYEGVDLLYISREIKIIKSKLATKDLEIELLNTEVKTAYHTIEQLQERVVELEKHRCVNEDHRTLVESPAPPSTCLLLGDTNLSPILPSDLHQNCWVRTIPGADMDLIRSWVNEKMHKSPSECILYSGTSDILDEHPPETILDNLGSLISDLKEKNSTMNVFVCKIVPSPLQRDVHCKIEDYNNHLVQWGKNNGIFIIDTVPTFKLGTGEIDDLCFDRNTNFYSTFNRLGTIKLLSTIDNQCPKFNLCPNWEKVKRSTYVAKSHERQRMSRGNTEPATRLPFQRPDLPARPTHDRQTALPVHSSNVRSIPPHHPLTTSRRPSQHRSSVVPRAASHPTHVRIADETSVGNTHSPYTYATAATSRGMAENRHHTALNNSPVNMSRLQPQQRHRQQHQPIPRQHIIQPRYQTQLHTRHVPWHAHQPQPQDLGQAQPWQQDPSGYQHPRQTRGCYNCGEHNHRQANCRFDHRLKCGICNRLGHKQKYCYVDNP